MKNRFNNITSKEWLPFQKSWFKFVDNEELYHGHIRFFIKYDDPDFKPNLYYYGNDLKSLQNVAHKNGAFVFSEVTNPFQYAILDLREDIEAVSSIKEYISLKNNLIQLLEKVFNNLKHRRFVSVIVQNKFIKNEYYPLAWDLSYSIASGFTLKDEKIACVESSSPTAINDNFFILNFRKDENSNGEFTTFDTSIITQSKTLYSDTSFFLKKWGIIRPPRRNKKEILHPAKFPENIISEFIKTFTQVQDVVFDPMSGTGSTQLAALQSNRNTYGTELSEFFADIAKERLQDYLNLNDKKVVFKILNKDARHIKATDLPPVDYIITSPPYWDMLNMKGAENQAKRIKKGLRVNYSDNNDDFGNISDYNLFIDDLVNLYFTIIKYLKPGGYMTIIVKNIKKKGKNYPFAWDLTRKLNEKLIVLPEFYWLQDDINLAPYGYGNTFVSNTFHQYCLTFQKPK